MAVKRWFWPGLVVIVGLNLAYAGWALASPPHEEEPIHLRADIPFAAGANASAEEVAANLRTKGWDATASEGPAGWSVVAHPPGEPDFHVAMRGLGGSPHPNVYATRSCMISYGATTCPGNDELELRERVARASADSGVPVDLSTADVWDNDFVTWDEFALCGGQALLILFSIPLVVGLASAARVAEPIVPEPAWPRDP